MLTLTKETVGLQVCLMTSGCPPPCETRVEQDPGYRTLFIQGNPERDGKVIQDPTMW